MIRIVARDRTGVVILRDYKPDGSYVLLECTEFEPTGGGGVLGLPADDEEFPMLAARNTAAYAETAGKKPFHLEVDLTEMPPGELRFHNREFIEEAVSVADLEKVRITPQDADRWGWIRRRAN